MKITSVEQLRQLYDLPKGRAKDKQFDSLDKHSIHFIENSPFLVLSTFDSNKNMDNSPRGGEVGFVKVMDNKQFIIPDAKGNNRMDSVINIIETNRVGILFLIPGIDETLRINGNAFISTDTHYLSLFDHLNNKPKACIVVNVEEMFLHCAKALIRSKLWLAESQIERNSFPTMGKMLKDQLNTPEEPESHEEMIKRYSPDL